MLTQAKVKELFDYDPETGDLIWQCNIGTHKTAGNVAGFLRKNGYKEISVNRKRYNAHRLVWLWHYGVFPANGLDHINGDKSDNCIENLREATKVQNAQNRRTARSDNKSGYLGVGVSRDKWTAQIYLSGKRLHIGCFDTPEAAHEAYLAKKRELHEFNTL